MSYPVTVRQNIASASWLSAQCAPPSRLTVIGFPTATAVEGEGDVGPTFLLSGEAVNGFHVGPYGRIGRHTRE